MWPGPANRPAILAEEASNVDMVALYGLCACRSRQNLAAVQRAASMLLADRCLRVVKWR